jgi:hypothetical protein
MQLECQTRLERAGLLVAAVEAGAVAAQPNQGSLLTCSSELERSWSKASRVDIMLMKFVVIRFGEGTRRGLGAEMAHSPALRACITCHPSVDTK